MEILNNSRKEKDMNVQEIKIEGKKRYMLIDNDGMPVIPAVRYIKHLDHIEKSYNTQKTYCYALKLFFEYLDEINIDYKEVNFDALSKFISWLRNPYQNTNIITISSSKSKRSERTVNLIITVVVKFYDYLYRNEEIDSDIVEKTLSKVYSNGYSNYKSFLYHINKNAPLRKNILKLKEPRRRAKTLSQEEVNIIYAATSNIRDKLLIKLLFETGLRIGEALSLYLEDFIYDHKNGHYIQLTNRGELPNGAKLKTGERKLEVSQELMDLFDDYAYEVLDELEIDTNFVFVKITGPNKGKPLDYIAVSSLFKRLKRKTGIDVHAHLFRHTHATIYYNQTKDIKQVQERLGHTQIQTTMNIYVHPSEDEKRDNWEIAQPAFKIKKGDTTNE